ncbi:HlyD family secretion protein [Macrococcus armenti]|uniref:HlyD family secretion protein n=1 Tax=Macrococcus armenti TaxID=2875764 RepID=UPI001CCACDBD|nr:HlyD family efflux transporter periplasmic adaptor subunit [Macrococcus armenti]UBH09086.1 HlyD family efflux transporter periplasmic adaptor subunit [Macrococcus armenti]UBH15866.1 HlyD family efflux transporter periplasmic adaptor subunit [Macrococcus armenti]UBH18226.1 HlyD family efflux transporter periplasmic adaptor subunit [Macrococcus armenti]UBH20492.1 HlyD family efflux transporter periplasmic adaptor subunit [Macrococcus armenti]
MKKLVMINILTLVILAVLGIVGFHFYDEATNYVKTDNAKVDGDQIAIASPVAGKLITFDKKVGDTLSKDDKLGTVAGAGQDGAPSKVELTMPQDGTLVKKQVTENGFVGAGTPIAYAYNMDKLFVTANIKETELDGVKKGQKVDVYVDGYKDTTLTGKVEQIGLATASSFSLLPSSNGNANFTKVTQVVPVKIELSKDKSLDILPGMNVTVRIHKN